MSDEPPRRQSTEQSINETETNVVDDFDGPPESSDQPRTSLDNKSEIETHQQNYEDPVNNATTEPGGSEEASGNDMANAIEDRDNDVPEPEHIRDSFVVSGEDENEGVGGEFDEEDEDDRARVKFVGSEGETVAQKLDNNATCRQFEDVFTRANDFVEEIIKEARDEVIEGSETSEEDVSPAALRGMTESYYNFIRPPPRESFDVEAGAEAIEKFVCNFVMKERWMYCIDYLGECSDTCKDYYKYEVKFSIPCDFYPVAQATASIFFTIEASRVTPKQCPVEIYYCMEGSRLQRVPWREEFHEEWLFYVIDAKLKLFKTLRF